MKIKNSLFKIGSLLCTIALAIGVSSVNVACYGWFHQPEVPTGMEKFRK